MSPTPQSPPPGSPGALERVSGRFELIWNEVRVGGHRLWLPEFADPLAYLEQRMAGQGEESAGLPYWTRLWPAVMVMVQFTLRLAKGQGPILELAAGLGLPGLVAASGGRRVVLTDSDPDALEFARATVEKNDLSQRVEVMALDWDDPPAGLGAFSTILGAEMLYQPTLFPGLVELLAGLLAPGGTAFFSHEARPFALGFFDLAGARFSVRRTTSRIGKGEDATTVYLYALTAREAA